MEISQLVANKAIELLKAISALPEGYCICPKYRDAMKETHTPECAQLRDLLYEVDRTEKGH